MKTPDLTQILAAEAVLRPFITDPKISAAALALQVVTAYLDAASGKKKKQTAVQEFSPSVITLPTNEPNAFYSVSQRQFDEFQALYPAVDIGQELRSMCAWLLNNKKQAKTATGMPRFINAWLAKNQNRSKPNGHGKQSNNDNWLAGAADLAAEFRSQRE